MGSRRAMTPRVRRGGPKSRRRVVWRVRALRLPHGVRKWTDGSAEGDEPDGYEREGDEAASEEAVSEEAVSEEAHASGRQPDDESGSGPGSDTAAAPGLGAGGMPPSEAAEEQRPRRRSGSRGHAFRHQACRRAARSRKDCRRTGGPPPQAGVVLTAGARHAIAAAVNGHTSSSGLMTSDAGDQRGTLRCRGNSQSHQNRVLGDTADRRSSPRQLPGGIALVG